MAGKVIRVCDECGSDRDISQYQLGRGTGRPLKRELCPPCRDGITFGTVLAHAERDADRLRRTRPQGGMRVVSEDELAALQRPQTGQGGTGSPGRPPRAAKRPPRA